MIVTMAMPILGALLFLADPGAIKQEVLTERNLFGQTPLHRASDESTTRRLINQGADIQARDDWGNSPLHEAARRGNLKLVQLLIQAGAKSMEQNAFGETPLDVAALVGHSNMVRLFVEQGAPLTIHYAAAIGDRDRLLQQVRMGADVNERTLRGRKPLHFAATKEAAQILLTHGAYLNTKDLFNDIPLHIAGRNGKAEVVEVLLDRGAWLHDTNFWGQTPLHYAAAKNRIEVAKILLARGADPKRKSANGKSAFDIAQEHKFTDLYHLFETKLKE